jgi:esterase
MAVNIAVCISWLNIKKFGMLAYEKFGAGKPILVLHGLFGSKRNWRAISKVLAKTMQVIAVDLRNHGDSFHSYHSINSMAGDVTEFVAKHGLGKCSLIGHSMFLIIR